MPQRAPPPYAGELCKRVEEDGEHDLDIARRGSYSGLCSFCRKTEGARRAERRRAGLLPESLERPAVERDLDGMRDEIMARSQRGPRLRKACEALTDAAIKLEEAVEDRNAATLHAGVVLREFKEALAQVGRTAKSLLGVENGNGG